MFGLISLGVWGCVPVSGVSCFCSTSVCMTMNFLFCLLLLGALIKHKGEGEKRELCIMKTTEQHTFIVVTDHCYLYEIASE